MLFAFDKNGNKVYIDSAERNQDYFCPFCESKLVQKKGEVKIHHFAHTKQSVCQDTWHYDMSEWHFDWQNKFIAKCQEVVKSNNNIKHRADVLIEDKKVVIEFQHSYLSADEFEERNSFYNDIGYKVVWLFDVEEQWEYDQIDNYRDNIWYWKNPKRTFDYYDYRDRGVAVYLQLDEDDIIKVTWCTDDRGLSRFATDGNYYTEKDFLRMFSSAVKEEKEVKLSELYDDLVKLVDRGDSSQYFGCPVTEDHTCIAYDPERVSGDCMRCQFRGEGFKYYEPICKKRFLDLNLDKNTVVTIESRGKYNFINKISYISDGQKIYIDLPVFEQYYSKSIFELWKEDYAAATFRNIYTGKYVRITKDPNAQYEKYHKVYGRLSSSKFSFPNSTIELFNVEKREWVYEWSRKRL